jgi:DME family drug/metabolite transporter
VLVAALFWAAVGPLSRLALATGLEPLQVAGGRALVAGIAFAAHLAIRGGARPRRSDALALVAFAGLGVASLFFLNQLAVQRGGAALATILLYTAPIWVALASPWLDGDEGEPRQRGTGTRALVAAAGIALLAAGGGTIHPTPAALLAGLGSGVAYAVYSLLARRLLLRISPQGIFGVAMPLAAALLLAASPPLRPTAGQAALVGVIGLLSFGGSFFYALGLRHLAAARATLIATVEPIAAAVLAALLFGERFGAWGLAGGVLVLAALSVPGTAHSVPRSTAPSARAADARRENLPRAVARPLPRSATHRTRGLP